MLTETLAAFAALSLPASVHQCQQGHRCVYYFGGKLQNTISDPGYHLKLPLFTTYSNVQVTWQTDRLTDVICGSSQGGHAYLDIEVVNKLDSSDECMFKVIGEHTIYYDRPLIYDYIPSEVAQFCKNYTLDDIVIREFDKLDEVLLEKLQENVNSYGLSNCIEIKKVRINRPKLDDDMRLKFLSIENEKKAMELAEREKETQRVRQEAETQKQMMEKDRQRQTNKVEMEIQLARARAEADKKKIEDQMNLDTKTSQAEAEKISLLKKAEGYETLLSNPEYIRLETMKTAYHNSKIVIGEIPKNGVFSFTDMPKTGYTEPILMTDN
jgi:regulator of protease activity HflC (stomatin/prohibitin superfamily)